MAHTATHHAPAFRNPFVAALEAVWNGLASIGEANALVRQVNALQAMSDAELANRGLKREDIARHVFASSMWV